MVNMAVLLSSDTIGGVGLGWEMIIRIDPDYSHFLEALQQNTHDRTAPETGGAKICTIAAKAVQRSHRPENHAQTARFSRPGLVGI